MNNTAHCCESQLLTINDLAVNLNNGGQTMLDFTKAFDKVFHELLYCKLKILALEVTL